MRDILVKLYTDEKEKQMIDAMAKKRHLSINRYLRLILREEAIFLGFSYEEAQLFMRTYTKRTE